MHWPGIEPGSPAWEAGTLPLNHQCPLELIFLLLRHQCPLISNCITSQLSWEDGAHKPTDILVKGLSHQKATQSGDIQILISKHLFCQLTHNSDKDPFQLYNRPLQKNMGNSSRSLVYDPASAIVSLKLLTLESLRKQSNLLG